jgi:mevalonate kinase
MHSTIARSPGRVCLLGDNTDLIDRPAIAAAISAYLTIELRTREDDTVVFLANDIDFRQEFQLGDALALQSPLRYLEAVYLRLRHLVDTGFEVAIHSEIPVSAGLSSSTALCIAFIRALTQAADVELTPAEIAELSYVVEREDLHTECGRMDQYAIAYGGVTYIHTGDDASAEKLPVSSLPIVVADTQEQHSTQELQVWLRDRIAIHEPVLMGSLLRVVDLVEQGKRALIEANLEELGNLMNAQQVEERMMGTSTDRLELFCQIARTSGALGAKQMGAGGGGCMIALCEPDNVEPVRAALRALGAPAWTFDVINDPV